ncbi:MAG: photosystem reaction center subunit H [Candidatus Goldiibacteriota bacterium HGW-Goldbacteria-1]|jgi:uncharacterized protein YrrD|nr:MAG: photosystem reaction center subunit H [Candidatus Goldiibacteriota bacterium HGW-Goldbacteria-1]
MLNSVKNLKGYKLKCTDGEIGEVDEFYFDDRFWVVRYLVASTGQDSLKKQVLISPCALKEVTREDKNIYIQLTKKQVEDAPSVDADKPVTRQFEEDYYHFFGWPVYWNGSSILDNAEKNTESQPDTNKVWNPNLRGTKYVTGYNVHAEEGQMGKVEDFIIDDEVWAIRYLVISLGKWFADKKVLVSPHWIESVSFEELKVHLNLKMNDVKESPEYTPETMPDRNYEERLHLHYKRQGYWRDDGQAHEG